MEKEIKIFLPGLGQQLQRLIETVSIKDRNILLIGSGTIEIAKRMLLQNPKKIEIIVEDYEAFIACSLAMDAELKKLFEVKVMDFESTDYRNEVFDLVYAQASISNPRRKKILKEIKRILKPDGIFCIGEIIKLENEIPIFVKDIFESSDLEPLFVGEIREYYKNQSFEYIDQFDLSKTLKRFYETGSEHIYKVEYLSEDADRDIGFIFLILKKS